MGNCHSWHYMVMLSKPSARKKSGPVETGLTRLAATALHSLKHITASQNLHCDDPCGCNIYGLDWMS